MTAMGGAVSRRMYEAQIAVGRAACSPPSLVEFFGRTSRAVAELLRAGGAAFWRLDPGGRTLALQPPGHGLPAADGTGADCDPQGDSPGADIVYRDRVFRGTGAGEGGPGSVGPLAPPGGIRGALAVPWRAGDRRLGVLAVYDPIGRDGFSEEDAWVLSAAAHAAGLVYQEQESQERVRRALREREQVEERLRGLLRTSQTLNSILDPQQVLDTLTLEAMELIGAEGACAGLRQPEGMVCHKYFRGAEELPFDFCWPPGVGVPGWLIENPGPYLTNQVAEDSQVVREVCVRFGIERLLSTPIVDAEGQLLGFFEIHNKSGGRDFTEADRDILSSVSDHAAIALKGALAHRRLGELERLKTDFINLAAHELRGPLAVARGYASMMLDGSLGEIGAPEVRRSLQIVDSRLAYINHLTNQLLEHARLEDQRLVLSWEPLDVRALVGQVAAMMAGMVDDRHQVVADLGDQPARVLADATRVEEIVANLADNAIKYSPAGGRVGLACAVSSRDGVVRVTVSDQGLGIAREHLDRLFTRFGRIVTPQNSHISGTGLGLYLARELARLHDGDLTLVSELGRGTVATLLLPLADRSPGEAGQPDGR